jgi:pimeloyl-ACP methyl ester carboxylesterase/DNA-binding SARP family transcriptional activator
MHGSVPPIQFAPSRGARLAYQIWGSGPAMVAIPPLAQNIEVAWEWPGIRSMHERFGSFSRYLVFDKRGTGASDRRSRMPGMDERVEDIRAVMDHAGIDSAHLFVQSDGGPMALVFAATYPHRVDSLTLMGSAATLGPPWSEEQRIASRERQVAEWGTPASRMVDFFAPSLAADQEYRDWHQRYERLCATADSLRDLLDLAAELDATEVLPDLDVPTLVIHRTGDRVVPVEKGRRLAAAIEGARLLELPGDDHFAYVGDLDEWMGEVERFVTGSVRPKPAPPAQPAVVHIATLGRFAVEVDGVEVPTSAWGSRLSRQLCKRLVAARGWPLTRDELIDMLWPDETDMRRLGPRLSVQLSAVRRVLNGGVIADRESVRLDLDEVSTDLEEFYKATDDAAIVAAYPGEFLPEDRYEAWTDPPRDEARARFVAAAKRLARKELGYGNAMAAAEIARRLVATDRYDSASHELLVDALVAAGEVGEARRAHEAWVEAMAELDVEVGSFPS